MKSKLLSRLLHRRQAQKDLSSAPPKLSSPIHTSSNPNENKAQRTTKSSLASRPYQYSPLNKGLQEIRLLYLLPGTFSDPIHIKLEAVSFTHDSVPEFEALSYTWGSARNPRDIFIGESDEYALPVTQNLAVALPYLRYNDVPRTLWIDAICVNQKDLVERGQQVQRMADIYSKASKVVVWLGPESEDSALAIDCIERVASHIKVDWHLLTMQPSTDNTDWADRTTTPAFEEGEFLALTNFMGRSWFERLWVWQEVRLASFDPVMLCGKRVLTWIALRNALFCFWTKSNGSWGSGEFGYNLVVAYETCSGRGSRLFERLIFETRHCKFSDPRDKVFAVLSMTDSDCGMDKLEPDYTKDPYEVYQDAMVLWTSNMGDLSLLSTVEMHDHLQKVPSWVPDWVIERTTDPLMGVNACGPSKSTIRPQFVGEVLSVTGVTVGKIEATQDFDIAEGFSHRREDTAQAVCKAVYGLDLTGPFIQGSRLTQELSVVLLGCVSEERIHPPDSRYPSRDEAERALCYTLNYGYASGLSNVTPTHPSDEESFQFDFDRLSSKECVTLDLIFKYCRRRSLFKSSVGNLGLAPAKAVPGDLITVLLGCPSAMILRLVGDSKYRVVGEALYQGALYGEALLGPLPTSVEVVLRSGVRKFAFINQRTKEFLAEDPRLGDLPPQWIKEKKPHNENFTNQFVNNITSEILEGVDPRMMPARLKERGVDLQAFDLV